jgi:phosphoenolpyruvate carboxylase
MALSAAGGKIERLSSIDAQLRLLVPGKLSDDDKLIEYDALLLDRFLDVLQGLHGDDLREMVKLFDRSISHRIQSIS